MIDDNLTGSQGIHLSLSNLLRLLKHYPVSITENEHLYQNVLHSGESSPSLVVHTGLNTWFDRMTMKSGDLLDFCSLYWPDLSGDEIVGKLRSLVLPERQHFSKRTRRAVRLPYYQIRDIKPLGSDPEITRYLRNSGLWQLASPELMEVYYFVIDEKKKEKHFCAAGWKNENGGWEVRCRNFSGCIGPKGLSFLSSDKSSSIALFEDFTAYLNWRYEHRHLRPDILILNHPEFREAALRRACKYAQLDHDGLSH